MKRLVITATIKLCGEAALLTILAGIVIAIIGRANQWDTPLEYSNAFFIAGSIVIIAGASSRFAAGQEWNAYRATYAESFRAMSAGERAKFIIDASSSIRLVLLGLLSGLLLILISAFAAYLL
jgi:hypothetical protein